MLRKPAPAIVPLRSRIQTRIIKKYPNRRLYDTAASRYVTLAEMRQLVVDGASFKAVDAKSGEDITRGVLLQIILEAEAGGAPMFTEDMLAHIIRFHGHAMQGFMGAYLEKNIQALLEIQAQMTERAEQLRGELARGQALKPEAWVQFMGLQSPLMQGLMGKYLEQSKTLFVQMQKQMIDQAGQTLAAFGVKRSS
ncbi:MAG: polyhydroxyalkanoate synthesis repressor PhaR [Burkholderiaceae bacterium]|jgi:polyhydroxyalkanoate synthesis repressor PhaR|nr:polyhydroxyalkanoate synthesis repressor PhaR [Burkholderiaceae bacterium]